MIIQLAPQRRDDVLSIVREGDRLTLNGETFDFGRMGEGDTLPADAISSTWFAGPVTRNGGELQLTLLLPLPANFSQAQAFPEPLDLASDGPVALPEALPSEQQETLVEQRA